MIMQSEYTEKDSPTPSPLGMSETSMGRISPKGNGSLQEASPARIFQWLAKALGWTGADRGYGLNAQGSLAKYDHDSQSWRMSEPLLFEGLTEFSGRLPKSGTMQSGKIYGPAMWGRPTGESGFGLSSIPMIGTPTAAMRPRSKKFAEGRTPNPAEHAEMRPTPQAGKIAESGGIVNADGTLWDGIQKPHSKKTGKPMQTALADKVKLWPTPNVRRFTNEGSLKMLMAAADNQEEFSGMAYRAGRKKKETLWPTPRNNTGPSTDKKHLSLDGAVKLWPTPNSRDWKDTGPTQGNRHSPNLGAMAAKYPTPGTHGLSNGSGNAGAINKLRERGKITEEERRSMRSGNGGRLNPTWVEWLMGYPLGWTDLNALATPLSLKLPG
jgi:hypothetical protein